MNILFSLLYGQSPYRPKCSCVLIEPNLLQGDDENRTADRDCISDDYVDGKDKCKEVYDDLLLSFGTAVGGNLEKEK